VTRWLNLLFVLLMLGLTALFAALGAWQVERLGEKERLIVSVAEGLASAPEPVETLQAAANYQPVSVSGTYHSSGQVLVFTSLGDAKGRFSGPGYWVMSPLVLDSGGTIFVNRGFIPQGQRTEFPSTSMPPGRQTLTGLARRAEAGGSFTPESDFSNGIDWIRDPQRLAQFGTDLPQPILPWFIDLPAGASGELPQGGETVVEFPNNHLGYAITWFGFAVLTPILLAFWIARQRKGGGHPPKASVGDPLPPAGEGDHAKRGGEGSTLR
jgi:surfeit locus 1 family protein